jgi:drug/metabolite transporter (DMT)-like permease
VHARLTLMIGPGPERDDLVQQIFLDAYRALPRFRGDARFATYLTRIAINVACVYLILWGWRGTVPAFVGAGLAKTVAMGAMMLAAYLSVLTAMSMAPVSYVVAAREIGVVVAALLGMLVLREPWSPSRLVAAVVIFSGLVVIAVSR